MLYIVMHKAGAEDEAGAKPTPELIMRVGEMVGELARSGALHSGEGLGPSSEGARVSLVEGQATVTRGPFSGENALPARYAIFRATELDAATDVAARFGRIFGDVVVDVRHVNEAWDLGFAPMPDGLTTRRYMAVVNADAASEAGTPLTREQETALTSFSDGLGADDFLAIGHLDPSARGRRIHPRAGAKAVVLDGPFTETKELIGGFVIVDVPSIDEAVRIALEYAEAVPVEEMDVRGLVTTP